MFSGSLRNLNSLGHSPICICSGCWPRQTWCQKTHDVPLHQPSHLYLPWETATERYYHCFRFHFAASRVMRLCFCSYYLLPFRQWAFSNHCYYTSHYHLCITLHFSSSSCTHLCPQRIIRYQSYSFIQAVQCLAQQGSSTWTEVVTMQIKIVVSIINLLGTECFQCTACFAVWNLRENCLSYKNMMLHLASSLPKKPHTQKKALKQS